MWKDIHQEGAVGTEGGLILADEEYKDACRITLEKCASYYAISFGMYGAEFHVAVCQENYKPLYAKIRKALQEFADKDPFETDPALFYEQIREKL